MYKPSVDADRSEVRRVLMDLLARREYSRAELHVKLRRRFGEHEDLCALLDEASDRGWQDDERFAAIQVRGRVQRGQGPIRIRQELRQKGVDADLIADALAAAEINWSDLARSTRVRKFGDQLPVEAKERARQMRFLAYRGFDGEMVRNALVASEFD